MDVPIFERTKQRLTNAGPFPDLLKLELIEADDEKATFKGQFFMETEAGKEAYNLAKEMETYKNGLLVLGYMIMK